MIAKDKICAVAAAGDTAGMWKQLSQALRVTRTVELRLDWLANEDELDRFLARLAKKRPRATLIATCRRRVAGGNFRGTIAQQLVHLASALRSGCGWAKDGGLRRRIFLGARRIICGALRRTCAAVARMRSRLRRNAIRWAVASRYCGWRAGDKT